MGEVKHGRGQTWEEGQNRRGGLTMREVKHGSLKWGRVNNGEG